MTLHRLHPAPESEGARANWFQRNRPPVWVFVAVAVGIGCELVVLHWIGVVWP